MDVASFGTVELRVCPEAQDLAAGEDSSPATLAKAEEQDRLTDPQEAHDDEGEEEEEEKEEEEMLEEEGARKTVRRGRAKAKRKGRGKQNLALADAQATAAAFTFMRKRRQDLTLGAKVKVLEMLEQEPKVPQGKIASMFRVSQSQVSRIMKNKAAIMAQWNRFATPDRKRCRLGKAGALQEARDASLL